MSGDPERAAFLAGFGVSSEGFNGEWGPHDEWIERYFEKWKHGTPVPSPCGDLGPKDEASIRVAMTNHPTCTRPPEHEGKHRRGALEWPANSEDAYNPLPGEPDEPY